MPGQLNLFGGKRQRGRSPPPPLEIALHAMVVGVLGRWLTPGWVWSHFPAGGKRKKRTAKLMQRMGTKRGWPDLILLAPGRVIPDSSGEGDAGYVGQVHFLELKRKGEKLSDEQFAFMEWCSLNGYPYVWCDNFDDALFHLKKWGAVRASVSA